MPVSISYQDNHVHCQCTCKLLRVRANCVATNIQNRKLRHYEVRDKDNEIEAASQSQNWKNACYSNSTQK